VKSADTNLFLYAANRQSPNHEAASKFFSSVQSDCEFVICELVLIELYMQLRNPAVMPKPLNSALAASFCETFKVHPHWQHIDYCPEVSESLWQWAKKSSSGFRRIIDARLGLTLLYHGVTEFATANVKDFASLGFKRVWNPLEAR
jgi:toxin-antitoxin system PIN domain toxin